jgi:hypothetical protein
MMKASDVSAGSQGLPHGPRRRLVSPVH